VNISWANRRLFRVFSYVGESRIIKFPINYAKYRSYEQIRETIIKYFKEHTEYSKTGLSEFLNIHCIDYVEIKKIREVVQTEFSM